MAQIYNEQDLQWLDRHLLIYQAFRHFAIYKRWLKADDGVRSTIISESVSVTKSDMEAHFEFSVLEFIPAGKDANGRWQDSGYMERANEKSCSWSEWEQFFAAFIERHTVEEMKKAGPYAILEDVRNDVLQMA